MDGPQLPAAHAVALMAGLPVRVVTGVGYKTEKVLAELGAKFDLFEPFFTRKDQFTKTDSRQTDVVGKVVILSASLPPRTLAFERQLL